MVDIWWILIKIVTKSIHTTHSKHGTGNEARKWDEKKAENVNKLIKHCWAIVWCGCERETKNG